MAEENAGAGQDLLLAVEKIYLKDMSFETPNSPEVFALKDKWDPDMNIQMNWASKQLNDVVYETVLSVMVTATLEDKTAYLVEVQQAGLFHINGFPEEDTKRILGTFCPGQLFPFAREAITNLISKGGFPHLLLKPVNFDLAYQEQSAQHAQRAAESEPAAN